jgi:CubicO group peptidase (beta-lactamase class C family)
MRKYIPELPEYGNALTIRHLMSHTGGLRDVFELQTLSAPSDSAGEPNTQS